MNRLKSRLAIGVAAGISVLTVSSAAIAIQDGDHDAADADLKATAIAAAPAPLNDQEVADVLSVGQEHGWESGVSSQAATPEMASLKALVMSGIETDLSVRSMPPRSRRSEWAADSSRRNQRHLRISQIWVRSKA